LNLLIIGGGTIGEAFARGLSNSEQIKNISIIEPNINRKKYLKKSLNVLISNEVRVEDQLKELVPKSDIILLSIKPQTFKQLSTDLQKHIKISPIIISVMAGINLEKICSSLKTDNVVRVMPNTPAKIGYGASIWISKKSLKIESENLINHILNSLGISIKTINEEDIDRATAISGSGPGYVFLIMEIIQKKSELIGLDRNTAKLLVEQTFLGAANLSKSSGKEFSQLRSEVTSAGGTTEAAINAMINDMDQILEKGISAALLKAKELNNDN